MTPFRHPSRKRPRRHALRRRRRSTRSTRAGRCGCATTSPPSGGAVTPADLVGRPPSLWRYRELLPLPLDAEPVTLGEGMTPLLPCPRLGRELGLSRLLDQGRVAAADRQLQEPRHDRRRQHGEAPRPEAPGDPDGRQRRRRPGRLRRPGRHGGVRLHARRHAASSTRSRRTWPARSVFLVNGLITDCGRLVREGTRAMGWFDMSTLKEPYRLEGKKTMGLELAEQLGWRLPDVILYPTGGGTGLIGMWKAFAELRELGWLKDGQAAAADQLPERRLRPDRAGLRDGRALRRAVRQRAHHRQRPARAGGGRRLHDARRHPRQRRLRRGRARGAHRRVDAARRRAARASRICPETAVCFDCLDDACSRDGRVRPDEEVVVFNTGAAQKYPEVGAARPAAPGQESGPSITPRWREVRCDEQPFLARIASGGPPRRCARGGPWWHWNRRSSPMACRGR